MSMTRRIRRNMAKQECGPGTELKDVWPAYQRGPSHDPKRRPRRSPWLLIEEQAGYWSSLRFWSRLNHAG